MNLKKILASVLSVIMLVSMMVVPANALEYAQEWQGSYTTYTTKYSDLPVNHWAYENVMRVSDKGWFNGYPDGTFGPNNQITRSEAAKVFVTFLGMEVTEITSTSFHDVDVNAWYAPYVEAGKDLIPVHTVPDGSTPFWPTQPITREDTIYALVVALGYDSEVRFVDESVLNMFKDQQSISRNLRPYVAYAVSKGLITGKGDGTIAAQDPLTRAEFATILYRGSMFGFNDQYEARLQSVTIDPSGLVELKVGESFTITAEGHYTDGSTQRYEINDAYNVDSNGVVDINQSRVTAVQPGNCQIKFKDENLADVSVVVVVTKEAGDVSMTFNQIADSTYETYVTISGNAKDSKGDTVTMTCNNRPVALDERGNFSHVVQLNVGQNNLDFVVRNSVGTSYSKNIIITRKEAGQPNITLDSYSSSTYESSITLSGKATNSAGGTVTVTCNGQSLPLDRDSTFSRSFSLREGDNTFNFEVKNEAGTKVSKSITVVRQNPGQLTLNVQVSDVGSSTTADRATITGSVYNSRGGRINLTCNGESVSVSQDGTFTKSVRLTVGQNTFTFEATNEGGGTISRSVSIERQDPGTVTLYVPESYIETDESTGRISGAVLDSRGGSVSLLCNDQRVSVRSDGTFEFYVNLSYGDNYFNLVATNEFGVSAEKTVIITRNW